jgi:phospholipase C
MIKISFRWLSLIFALSVFWGLCSCSTGSSSQNSKPPTTPVSATAPTVVFSASTDSIEEGQSVALNWQTNNASSITITATAGTSTRTVTTSSQTAGTISDSPTQTTTYSAVAAGDGGNSKPQSATVEVAQPVPPTITQFSVSPVAVNSGQTATLTWATTNATSVTITPGIPGTEDSGPLPVSGSSLIPVTATTQYSITASGPGGSVGPQTVTVSVPFTLMLNASPSTIPPGQSSTLSWQVANGSATSLTVTDASGNPVCNPCALPQGSATVTPATTTTYTASAAVDANTSITQSSTITVSAASAGIIKHIFFMLQENRSFDNYFGQLGSYRTNRLAQLNITDTQTVDGFDPTVTLTNSNNGAKVQPFHEASVCTGGISPAWAESHHDVSLVGGDSAWSTTSTFTDSSFLMQGFLDTTTSVPDSNDPNGTRPMGYYNEQDLPYYYDLATFFGTSDRWYSPILANTVPNRMYMMAGTSFGHEYPDTSGHPAYAAATIFRAMNQANVSWLYYYKDGIFLANFADFADPAIGPKTFPVDDLLSRLGGSCSGAPCDPDKALPEVIFIDSGSGASGTDEHPLNNIQTGAAYVQKIISGLMQSDAWQDSVFILSYDEGGALYDHVPPFMVPLPDTYAPGQCPDPNNGSPDYCLTGSKFPGTFNLTGLRVPLIVISPYVRPHFVSHTPRDYTAILAFIEKTFNVPALTARDAYFQDPARDMSEFFDFSTPALLTPPTAGTSWTQFLSPQTANGTCDKSKEAGPTL